MGPADRAFEQQFNIPGTEAAVANGQIVKTYDVSAGSFG